MKEKEKRERERKKKTLICTPSFIKFTHIIVLVLQVEQENLFSYAPFLGGESLKAAEAEILLTGEDDEGKSAYVFMM